MPSSQATGDWSGWGHLCPTVHWPQDVRAAVVREVKEETGLDTEVEGIVDVLSTHHPATEDRPDRSVVGVYFSLQERGGALEAGDDAAEARFCPLDDLPAEMAFAADRQIIAGLKESGAR